MKSRVIKSEVTVNEASQVMALCITMLGRLYCGDRNRILAAIKAYFDAAL